ncbi:MAG: patatin-like phospholipase family protein [Dehalococcoidia bacterium]|nr:patatin-like phospholipase family protein [Dehalococcoidia bacterium]
MSKKKIGLALGGGIARGLAHIGVLEVLAKESIPIDIITGTSAGAVIGALYAAGVSPAIMREYVSNFNLTRRWRLVDPKLPVPKNGFIQGERITKEMKSLMGGDKTFTELITPFACVACDIIRGEEVVLSHGSVCKAVHASFAFPVVFNPVKLNGRYLVDGGIINEVPVSVARDMGAEFVIAVDVIPQQINHACPKEDRRGGSPPGLMTVVMNTLDIINMRCAKTCLFNADVIIAPQTANFTITDFGKAGALILEGEMAAIDAISDIRRHMAQW